MRVTCERCSTEYRFDDSRVTEAGVRVKCTRCDHVFLVRRKSFVVTEAVPVSKEERDALDRAASEANGKPDDKHRQWLIRRGDGELLEFKEMTTLQRWIVERRVARNDEISHNGERWKRLGSIPELESFFAVIEATPQNLDEPAPEEPTPAPLPERPSPEPAPPPISTHRPPARPPTTPTAVGRVETVSVPAREANRVDVDPMTAATPRQVPMADLDPPLPPQPSSPPPRPETSPTPPPQSSASPDEAPDPAWSREAPRAEPEPVPVSDEDDDDLQPRRKGRGGRLALLFLLLLVAGAGAYMWFFQNQRTRELIATVSTRARELVAGIGMPTEATDAVTKGEAFLREDTEESYKKAEAEFRAALQLAGNKPFPAAAAGLAESLALQDMTAGTDQYRAEINRYAEEAVAANDSMSAGHRARAWHALVKKDLEAADAAIVQALARDNRDANAYTLRATIYLQDEQRRVDAQDALRQALAIDPELPRANYLMAKTLVDAGDLVAAKPFATRATAASPQHKRAEELLKLILAGGSLPTATPTETPTPVVQHTPRPMSADALVTQGYKAMESGDYDRAIHFFERAIDIDPDNSETYALLGLAHLRAGNLAEAEGFLLSARNLNRRYADSYRYLGMLYATRGDNDKAIENFQRYLDIRPSGSDAEDVRRRLAKLQGQ